MRRALTHGIIAIVACAGILLSIATAFAVPITYVFQKTISTVPGFNPVATVTINGTFSDLPTITNTGNPGPYDFGTLLGFHFESPDPGFGTFGLGNLVAQSPPYGVPIWSISPAGIDFASLVSSFHFYFPPSGLVVASDFGGAICPRSCIADGAWIAGPTAIPEPPSLSLALAGLGLMGGGFYMWRTKPRRLSN